MDKNRLNDSVNDNCLDVTYYDRTGVQISQDECFRACVIEDNILEDKGFFDGKTYI